MDEQKNPVESHSEEDFTFIKEKIKDKPLNKRRLAVRTFVTFLLAVLFGLVAAVVFTVGNHYMEDILYPERTEEVKLPIEEDAPAVSENEAVSSNTAEETKEQEPEQVINKIVERVEMSVEDYENLFASLRGVATEAEKSIVSVTGVTSDVDWFQNTYQNTNQAAGLIVADNGKQLLILVNKSVTDRAQHISVEFADHMTAEAVLYKYDSNTGLAVIGVDLSEISEQTQDSITMAVLGSSRSPGIVGKSVIAIGSPLGTQASVAYGLITSSTDKKQLTDTDVNLITTDIYGSKQATGVIINLAGEVLGIITQNYHSTDRENLITAYSISDLKDSIAKLLNGQDRARLGILGTDVTDVAKEELGIPQGAYVTEIVMDSPAMDAGIQSGDVIIKFGTMEITNFNDFKTAMDKSRPGDNAVITVMRFAMGEYTEVNFEATLGILE
ncbi:PDZ domain-containing protein [bacterium C-53]|nr:PDZ domain-containing protein [Lachnospiraceae bacterium]NBI02966.1 PDZ domain-containing protein [Lachnospiraceae bacterium]RKJ10586.1 PDZ domain-containing protein [bacterium C-53]